MVNKRLHSLSFQHFSTLLISLSFLLFSGTSFSTPAPYKLKKKPHVLSLATAITDEGTYRYGIASYETKGKGKWGMYGEMLFFSDGTSEIDCNSSNSCTDVLVDDAGFSFTAGGAYGFTNRFYGLVGLGFHYNKFSTEPLYDQSSCDSDDSEDQSQYCIEESKYKGSGQLGLLYITPIGLSLSGTVNTEKTLSFGVGYKF